jgi:hypothetical protein
MPMRGQKVSRFIVMSRRENLQALIESVYLVENGTLLQPYRRASSSEYH